MSPTKIQSWFPKRKIAARYHVSMRTVERWVKAGRYPKPTRLPNGRDYWSDLVVEQHDRDLLGNDEAAA